MARSHEETRTHLRLVMTETLHPNLRVVYGLTAEGAPEELSVVSRPPSDFELLPMLPNGR